MRQRATTRGFSLVEMLAALVIFSVAVVGTLQVFSVGVRAAGTTRSYTRASFLCQQLVEETVVQGDLLTGTDSGTFDPPADAFRWTREIAATDTDGLYEVRVSVTWPEPGTERSFELVTLAAER